MVVRCETCGEEFPTPADLEAHTHEMPGQLEGGAGFECPRCGEAFLEEDDLIRHEAADHAGHLDGEDPARVPDRPERKVRGQGFIKRRLPYPRS